MSRTARRRLDERFSEFKNLILWQQPPSGWIKAIRESLSMTTRQLAERLSVSQSRVVAIEKDEVKGALKLETLEKVAKALDCRLVYALVPKDSLENMLLLQARLKAKKILADTNQTMSLENQMTDDIEQAALVDKIIHDLLQASESRLWD